MGQNRWLAGAAIVVALVVPQVGVGGHAVALDGVVTDIAVGPVEVFPAFDEDAFDYGVRCVAGSNEIDITVAAPSATGILVDGVPVASGVVSTASMVADDLVTVEVADGAAVDVYHYRCLPEDWPAYVIDKPGVPGDGYYFVSLGWPRQGVSPQGTFVALLDTNGAPLWYKRTRLRVMDQKRLSDGTFAWLEGGGPGPPSYERRTLDGSLIGHLRTVGQETDNHDYLELANGNVMLMSYVDRACVDLTELGLGDCETAIDGYLQEIDPVTGALEWEWRSQDHIPMSDTALGAGLRSANDLVHLNSVDEFPDGDLLVSARSAGVYRIDRSTGAVEWKLGGGPSASRLTMIDDPFDGTWRQHDARVLDDDTISVYDNQSGLNRARAVVIDLDEPNDTATLVWEKLLGGGVDSPFIGAHRVQPDGHSVITWGGTLPFFEEVDAAGNRVFALNLNTQFEYRVVKYQPDDFDADQLRAAAGGMVEYDAPTDVVAVAGDREATVSWVAPTIGSPTGYTATASPGGQSCTTTGALSCTVTELNRGQSYVFNVAAANDLGGSTGSLDSNSVTIADLPGGTISGRVTDSATGVGIGGASVRVFAVGTQSFEETTTESDGGFAIDRPGGFYKVEFSAPGYDRVWWDSQPNMFAGESLLLGPAGVTGVDQALTVAVGTLAGRVTEVGSGVGVPGASVRVYPSGSSSFVETTTGADGGYSIVVPTGFYKVRFAAPGYPVRWWSDQTSQFAGGVVVLGSNGAAGVDQALPRSTGTLAGRVTDAGSGVGVEGAVVRVYPSGSSSFVETTTGADGGYSIVVPTGFYKVRFVAPGYPVRWWSDQTSQFAGGVVVLGSNGAAGVDQALPRSTGTLAGTVTDAGSGVGVVGASVRVYPSGSSSFVETTTGADGGYSVVVPTGFYKVRFSGLGYQTSWFDDRSSQFAAASLAVGAWSPVVADAQLS